jgi:(p)ppGpp synthase/HD superfamily hydrolase
MIVHPFPAESAQKRFIALRYWLQGREYYKALRYMDFNRRFFTGVRKDGVTPEFDHHVCQAQYLRTILGHIRHPEETLATIFSHDTPEDKDVSREEIKLVVPEDPIFGERVAQATWRVTKEWKGERFNEEHLFARMAECPIASIVKGMDRIHNFQTMVGVFTPSKQKAYLKEGEDLFLPMLKDAEQRFPDQEPAYKNIRTFLKTQISLIRAIHQMAPQELQDD